MARKGAQLMGVATKGRAVQATIGTQGNRKGKAPIIGQSGKIDR